MDALEKVWAAALSNPPPSMAPTFCRARLATVTLFQLPVTLRLTTLFQTSYCLPPVSVACYIPLLPAPTSCIYRASRASFNRQSSHTACPVQQNHSAVCLSVGQSVGRNQSVGKQSVREEEKNIFGQLVRLI